MKTVETHTMPARWASALINCDYTSPGVDIEFWDYFGRNPEFKDPVSCSEKLTLELFTFYPDKTLLTECIVYTFLRTEK